MKEMLKDLLWIGAVVLVAGIVWFLLSFIDNRLDDGRSMDLPLWFRLFG